MSYNLQLCSVFLFPSPSLLGFCSFSLLPLLLFYLFPPFLLCLIRVQIIFRMIKQRTQGKASRQGSTLSLWKTVSTSIYRFHTMPRIVVKSEEHSDSETAPKRDNQRLNNCRSKEVRETHEWVMTKCIIHIIVIVWTRKQKFKRKR